MKRLVILLFINFLIFQFSPAQASNALGLTVEIIPSTDVEVQRISSGQSLWFVIPPGSTQTRSFRVTSTSSAPEIATFSLGFLGRVDGEPVIDDAKVADSTEWASFNPPRVRLAARSSAVVTFTYRIPRGSDIGIHEAYLFATASPISSKSEAEYRVTQNARIAVPIFLGVGTTDQIRTDFEIVGVKGATVDGIHNVRMIFDNTGKTPIRLNGSIQLSSTVFKSDVIGPLSFNSLTIRPGEKGFVDAPVPNTMVEGEYDAFLEVSQGAITKTKRVRVDINFDEPSKWIYYLLRIAISLIFALMMYFSWRFLRKPRSAKTALENVNEISSDISNEYIEKMLAEITARALRTNSAIEDIPEFRAPSSKKKVATKAPVKKKVAKKAEPTKAPVRKKTVKKAPPKKKNS